VAGAPREEVSKHNTEAPGGAVLDRGILE